MDFYPQLTKLLTITHDIEEFENQKKVDFSEKKKKMKKFFEYLKSMLNCKIQSEESRNFRLYFIEYLSDIISSNMSFCPSNDIKEIENLIKAIKQNKNINNNNIIFDKNINNDNDDDEKYIRFDDINNKKSENYELKPNYIDENNKFLDIEAKNTFSNINGFYPKSFKTNNNNINKQDKENNCININHKDDKNEHFKLNEIKKDSDSYDNEECNNNNNNIFFDIENNIDFDNQNSSYKIKNNKIKNNNNHEDKMPNKNIKNNNIEYPNDSKNNNIYLDNNIINNNSNKNAINFENINNNNFRLNNFNNFNEKEIEKDIIENKENKEINNNKIDDNIKINEKEDSTECSSQRNNYSKEKINNINRKENNLEEKNKYKKSKPKVPLPKKNYQKKINSYYNYIFNDNISQFFIKLIKDKNNNDNFNSISTKIFVLVENNIIEKNIEQEYKEKIVTLICILFYFGKGQKSKIKDKIFDDGLEIDKDLFKFLRKNILIPDNSKYIEFKKSKTDKFFSDFCKDLSLENKVDGKNLIFSVYTFLVISRCLRDCSNERDKQFFEELLEKEYLITFKIKFILRNQEYYKDISDDFIEIYHGLHFIKVFYNEIFCGNNKEIRIMKDENIGKYIFGKEKIILSFDKVCNFDIDILFSELDNKIYTEVMEKIEHFYSINQYNSNDINDLINYSTNKVANKEFNIILNIVEHICEKKKYIYNNFAQYKKNLINLEKQIFELGQKNLKMNRNEKIIGKYSIRIIQKIVFDSLLENINKNINKKYDKKFNLYPYGSITQFLGGNDSDIDIYLDIRKIQRDDDRINFLYNLRDTIKKITNSDVKLVISTRLCVINFKYSSSGINYDFDISLMGFCPYFHSVLIRSYSLMEPRFPLLGISLKHFIKLLNIKNSENKQDYLNSFSWMILLITFLQDIIYPQILPKILSDKNNNIKNIGIEYGQNQTRFKDIKIFVENIKKENTFLPDSLFNKDLPIQIYKKLIDKEEKKNIKNNLSCSEIFLYFLEFIIYYFKNDSIYVNCSIENEGYESMHYILNNNDINQKNISDDRFQQYFKYKYCKSKNYNDNKKTRDGLILIRDPLDPHYNPAQSLRSGSYNRFINRLKKGYINLLKYGDFDMVKNDIDDE